MRRVKVAYLGPSVVIVVFGMCINASYDYEAEKHYIEIRDVRDDSLHRVYLANIIKWEDVPDPK